MEENIALEETIPTEQQPEATEEIVTDTTQSTEETDGNETEATETEQTEAQSADTLDETEEQAAVVIPVKYNKEYRELSIEEASTLAQKGLKFDSIAPMLQQINYIAASEGKTPAQIVQELYDSRETNLRQSLGERVNFDEELVEKLMELEHSKAKNAYEAMLKAQEDAEKEEKDGINTRLATEFSELQAEFPEFKEFKSVPKSVIDFAVKKNISLYDAYLRHKHTENKKQANAAAVQTKSAKATTGSQASATQSASDTVDDALLRGIWGH